MKYYIDNNNQIWAFDSFTDSNIPSGLFLIPNTYTVDQFPYLTLVNGNINFNSSAYNSSITAQKISDCKSQAQSLLQNTDWSEIPSVTNTVNTPHLINASDFVAYRNALRVLAVNPVVNPTWPTRPTEQWSS
jgi:exo-beta-1,3-glucanase (GH17 family)